MSYLQESSIQTQIGAQQLYQECGGPDSLREIMFQSTGDSRPSSIMYMYIVSCSSIFQVHAASSLPSAQWYRAAFKFSSGQVMLVGTLSFDYFVRSMLMFFFLLSTHADWICNTAGVQAVVANIQFAESAHFNSASLVPYTVNGVQYGTFKTAGKLSFLNVFKAGHEIPAYQPIVALQAFIQTISQQPLSST